MVDKKHFTALAAYQKATGLLHESKVDWEIHTHGMKKVVEALESKEQLDEKVFRWCYAAVVALAKRNLQQANNERENEGDWPKGQEWDDLAGSSKAIFLHKARAEAGIPDDEFLAIVRSGNVDVDDLYGR